MIKNKKKLVLLSSIALIGSLNGQEFKVYSGDELQKNNVVLVKVKNNTIDMSNSTQRNLLSIDQKMKAVFNDGLKEAVIVAVEKNPDTRLQDAIVRQSESNVGIARAAARPSLRVDASTGREYGDLQGSTKSNGELPLYSSSLNASQLITDFGATKYDIKSAKSAYHKNKYNYKKNRDDITSQVAKAYLDVAESRDLLFASDMKIAAQERVLRLVEESEKKGNATSADVARAQSKLSYAKSIQKDLEAKLHVANDEFYRLLGNAPGFLKPVEDVSVYIENSLEGNLAKLPKGNHELLALEASLDESKNAKRSVKATSYPKIYFNGKARRNENENGIEGVRDELNANISLNIDLIDGGKRNHMRSRAQAKVDEAKARYDKALMRVNYQLRSNWRGYEKSDNLKELTRTRVLENTKVADLYEAQFKVGKRTLFELLDSQNDLYNARSEEITNRYSRLRASYAILQLTGQLYDVITDHAPTQIAKVDLTCAEFSTSPDCGENDDFVMADNGLGSKFDEVVLGKKVESQFKLARNTGQTAEVKNVSFTSDLGRNNTQSYNSTAGKNAYEDFVVSKRNYNELDNKELMSVLNSILDGDYENKPSDSRLKKIETPKPVLVKTKTKIVKSSDKTGLELQKIENNEYFKKSSVFNTPYEFDDLGDEKLFSESKKEAVAPVMVSLKKPEKNKAEVKAVSDNGKVSSAGEKKAKKGLFGGLFSAKKKSNKDSQSDKVSTEEMVPMKGLLDGFLGRMKKVESKNSKICDTENDSSEDVKDNDIVCVK